MDRMHGKPSIIELKDSSWSLSQAICKVVEENDDDDYGAIEKFADEKTLAKIQKNKLAYQAERKARDKR